MKKRLLFLILNYFAWLPLFIIQKPWFMTYNHPSTGNCSLADGWKVILHGLKLDCTVAGYLTIIPLLMTLLSTWIPGKWYKKGIYAYTIMALLLIAAIFSVDVALYSFWGFRIDSTLFFYLQSPKDAFASIPARLFLQQTTSFLIYSTLGYIYLKKAVIDHVPTELAPDKIRSTFAIILAGVIMFIPIRGGITTSTANVGMVYFSQNQFLNHSAINPCFSLLSSLSKKEDFAKQFNFLDEEERQENIEALLSPVDSSDSTHFLLKTKRPNILIIILESFSANAVAVTGGEANVTPHINQIGKEGILFSKVYANSFRTDRGLVAVLNGYPAQPTTSIMKYPAKSQTLPSIASSLKKEGYESDMLYGGDINFTNMQSYFFSSGYSQITSDKFFPLSDRLSKWGANDDVTFNFLYNHLKKREKATAPWMTTFLTLSSHEPFEVPFHRFSHPYLNSVAFTDSCLGNFISRLKKTEVWDNLLMVLVADHGFRYPEHLTEYEPDRFHIPMIWCGGAIAKPKKIKNICNQTDLAATLLGQLGIPHQEYFFSKDILSPHRCDYSFYTFNNGFAFADSSGQYTVYDNESNRVLIEDQGDNNDRLLKGKALLQTLYDDLGNR